jgi:23S rRNA (cytosine1962-C5)-methyltransferase
MPKHTVTLKPGREAPIRAGHPWVFSNGVARAEDCRTGDVVRVYSAEDELLGTGTFHAGHTIRVRMVAPGRDLAINTDFFAARFKILRDQKRQHLPPNTDGYRLVHGDADYLPGLVVDIYADVAVFQIHTAGMETFRDAVIAALKRVPAPQAIVERSDVEGRTAEGLKGREPSVVFGDLPDRAPFTEDGIRYIADPLYGQKTGFFLDQRPVRRFVRQTAERQRIWNLFSYTGAFTVAAALGGAESILSVDASNTALEGAAEMLRLNGIDPQGRGIEFQQTGMDAFFAERASGDEKVDRIICDPPAFAKHRSELDAAGRGYIGLNQACFRHVASGGMLVTSSCSGVVSADEFRGMVRIAAGNAGRDARIVGEFSQPPDHTRRIAFPEGAYLKTLVLEVE